MLEIGVGSGLLLGPLAAHCEVYWGTDFSQPVIDRLAAQTADLPGVELRCLAADDEDGLPAEFFDTVVLNSVVQYFPDSGYLSRVLEAALRRLAPGGRILIGDVRNQATLRHFLTAVLGPEADPAEVERALLTEKELVIDPEFFIDWAGGQADVGAVDVRLRPGTDRNELTRHRYDVLVHKTPVQPLQLADLRTVAWESGVPDLPPWRRNWPGTVAICGCPGSRTPGWPTRPVRVPVSTLMIWRSGVGSGVTAC